MDDTKGKLTIRSDSNGVYYEASNVPTSLLFQVIDTHNLCKRRETEAKLQVLQHQINSHKEESNRNRLKDFLQSVFVLAILVIAFGYTIQLSGCGQQSPYNQQQWGSAK